MHYTIRHVTRFTYETPISESVMEVRMQPRTDAAQRCLHFGLSTQPASRVMMYQDHDGNIVHHFNIPERHSRLTVTAEALVECGPPAELPPTPIPASLPKRRCAVEPGLGAPRHTDRFGRILGSR